LHGIRKSGLTGSALADKDLFMSAAARNDVVSLDEYRRARGAVRGTAEPAVRTPALSYPPVTAALWVYWVPVWIW
jgi:hypothetical protein